jgi:prepilin-type N-terminal cleavage/methylation domain-containing protein
MYKKGLTLTEILVSTVILALVALGLTNVFVSGKRQIVHSRARMTTAELGKYFLDPLEMDVRQDQWGNNCLSSNPTTGCPTTPQSIDNITYTPAYTINNVTGTTLRKVKLTISWNEPQP